MAQDIFSHVEKVKASSIEKYSAIESVIENALIEAEDNYDNDSEYTDYEDSDDGSEDNSKFLRMSF